MAPRGTPTRTPQVSRTISRAKPSPAKKSTTMSVKKTTETQRLKENTTVMTTKSTVTTTSTTVKETRLTEPRQRTRTEPLKVATPKSKESKSVPAPGSVSKSAKKAAWRRRPKPAHSGVPVPEKMRKLLEKYLLDDDAM